MTSIITTPPAIEPVTIADARLHLRVTHTDEDALISRLIEAARAHVEQATRRALITQGWRLYLDAWPPGRIIRLPVSPVQRIDAVTVYDADGMPVALDPGAYTLDGASSPARVRVHAGAPAAANGVEIDFIAGYGDEAGSVPAALVQAILLLVGQWYEFREAGSELATAGIPFGFDALTAGYRAPRL
ncbi:phage head-tail connector protein [Stappia sp. F7233]|uniref:Phage head-tail connector protein n=1 Tax=Stappia albiluteola TaxID=2758565 RepID=A0A839ABN5_9HYPH|nr:head-tail connector protein [Stappia albiluteola]MBA5776362.1 phage head-tail connector protein [Stappia albiluteola]